MTKNLISFNEESFRAQLSVMLAMQDAANLIMIGDNWTKKGIPFHRAIYVEAAEYLEHLADWKWWKKGSPQMAQAQLELIDILHFGLSWSIVRFGPDIYGQEAMVNAIAVRVRKAIEKLPAFGTEITTAMRHEQVDSMIAEAGGGRFDTDAFIRLVAYTGMNLDSLFFGYIGKNMLNRHRQRHGDKKGTYIKVWEGEEDNVHLQRLMESLAHIPPTELADKVDAALEAQYAIIKAKAEAQPA